MSKSKSFGPGLNELLNGTTIHVDLALREAELLGDRVGDRALEALAGVRVVELPVEPFGVPPPNQGGKAGLSVPTVSCPGLTRLSWALSQPVSAAVVRAGRLVVVAAAARGARWRAASMGSSDEPLHARDPTIAGMAEPFVELEVGDRVVKVTNPDKVYFSARGETKLDLVRVLPLGRATGIVRALYERPTQLKRHPGRRGGRGDLPEARAGEAGPSGSRPRASRSRRAARGRAVRHRARAGRLGREPRRRSTSTRGRRAARTSSNPDELRIDLDPQPGTDFARREDGRRRSCARCSTRSAYVGWPKTSGNRGIHVCVPDRAELGVPRGAPLRARVRARGRAPAAPKLVTTAWWKEERGERVFIDYNQNARDRTIASAYSVRARPDATVSAPVTWDELPDVETEDFTIATMPARFAELGDVQAGIDDARLRPARAARVGRARRAARASARRRTRRTSRRCRASRSACSPRGARKYGRYWRRAATRTSGRSGRAAAAPRATCSPSGPCRRGSGGAACRGGSGCPAPCRSAPRRRAPAGAPVSSRSPVPQRFGSEKRRSGASSAAASRARGSRRASSRRPRPSRRSRARRRRGRGRGAASRGATASSSSARRRRRSPRS